MSKTKTDKLSAEIMRHRSLYENHQPEISDAAFDALCKELHSIDPENPALTAVGAPIDPSSEWPKAKHLVQLGSLNKVQTPEELTAWIENTFKPQNSIFWIEKLDGFSIGLQYENGVFQKAITRAGGGWEGEDISRNVAKMSGFIKKMQFKFTGTIRAEIILKKSLFKAHFHNPEAGEYKNARNAAAGIARRSDGSGSEHLDILAYQVIGNKTLFSEAIQLEFLAEQGFQVPHWGADSSSKKIENIIRVYQQYQNGRREALDYLIDGLVIRINELSVQKALGAKHLRPVGAMAFKFEAERALSKVIKIDDQVGSIGRITPVATIEPVELAGVLVSRATLHNYGNIRELGLNIGDEVIVSRRNDVIPYIEEVVHSEHQITGLEYKAPKLCPSCNGKTEMQGEFLVCTNVDNCKAQIIGRLGSWVSKHKIDEIGDKLLTQLVEKGLVEDVYDLYQLKIEDVAELDRMGEKSAKKVVDNLWAKREMTLANFLGALSIPLAGRGTFKLLVEAGLDTIEKMFDAPIGAIEQIKGIGPERAQAIVAGLRKNRVLIDALLDCVEIEKEKPMAKKNNKLNGKHICITGKTDIKRDDLSSMIAEAGGVFDKAVGKTTNILVIADPSSTSIKATKARAAGVKLISESELLGMMGVEPIDEKAQEETGS